MRAASEAHGEAALGGMFSWSEVTAGLSKSWAAWSPRNPEVQKVPVSCPGCHPLALGS